MVSIKIYNVTSPKLAEPLVRMLKGKTYMDLQVSIAPAGGSFDVWVSTSRPDTTQDDLREMVMSVFVSMALSMTGESMLRVLAVGCDRVNDGDLFDRGVVELVDLQVATHLGLARRGTYIMPFEEVREGYAVLEGKHDLVWRTEEGWESQYGVVPEGTTIYVDRHRSVVMCQV